MIADTLADFEESRLRRIVRDSATKPAWRLAARRVLHARGVERERMSADKARRFKVRRPRRLRMDRLFEFATAKRLLGIMTGRPPKAKQ